MNSLALHEVPDYAFQPGVPVSSTSVFADHVWNLDSANPSSPPCGTRVVWGIRLWDKSRFTDARYAPLLESSKRLIYALLLGKATRGVVKSSTALAVWKSLRFVVRWMTSNGLQRFADLDDAAVSALALSVRSDAKADDVGESNGLRGSRRIDALTYIFDIGEFIGDKASFTRRPSLTARSKEHCALAIGIPFIPDDVAIPLYQAALAFIEIGDSIVALKEAAEAAASKRAALGYHRAEQLKEARKTRRDAWLELRLCGGPVPVSVRSGRDLFTAIKDLETAAYIVVAGFTGMRISEVCGLNVDCLSSVSVGDANALALKSSLIKTAPVEREAARWVAGPDTPEKPGTASGRTSPPPTNIRTGCRGHGSAVSELVSGRRGSAYG
jgi:hypothetical protein